MCCIQPMPNKKGPECIRCGFGQEQKQDYLALVLDHKRGGGNEDRKRLGGLAAMLKYYANHLDEATEKLQVLCSNCNTIKSIVNNEN